MKEPRIANLEDLEENSCLFSNDKKLSCEEKDSLCSRVWNKNWILLGGIFQSNIIKKVSDQLN